MVYCIWEEYDAACPWLGLSWLWVWEEFPIFGWRLLLLLLLLLMAARQMQPVELLLKAVVQATATVALLGVATTVPAAAAAAETAVPNAMWVSAPWANRA